MPESGGWSLREWDRCPCVRAQRALLSLGPYEDTVSRQPSSDQAPGPNQTPDLPYIRCPASQLRSEHWLFRPPCLWCLKSAMTPHSLCSLSSNTRTPLHWARGWAGPWALVCCLAQSPLGPPWSGATLESKRPLGAWV